MKTITGYQDKIPEVFIRIEAYAYPTWTMLKDAHCFFSFVDSLQSYCNYSLVHKSQQGVPELVTKHSNNQQGKTGVETHTDKFLLCKVHFLQLPHFLLVFFLEFLCSFFLQQDRTQMQ